MPADREGGSQIEISDLVAALKSLSPGSGDQPKSPSEGQASSIEARISSGFMPPSEMMDYALPSGMEEDIDLSSLFNKLRPDADRHPQTPSSPRRVRRVAIAILASALFTSAIAGAATRAPADGVLRPMRLKIEAVRLALSSSDLSRATLFGSILEERSEELREHGADHPKAAIVADEMAAAGLGALQVLEKVGVTERSVPVIADIYGQALAADMILAGFRSDASWISRTRETIKTVAIRTGMMLRADDSVATSNTAETTPGVTAPSRSSGRTARRSSTKPQPAAAAGPTSSTATTASPGTGTPPNCDASAGEICLHAPTLPVTPPKA